MSAPSDSRAPASGEGELHCRCDVGEVRMTHRNKRGEENQTSGPVP